MIRLASVLLALTFIPAAAAEPDGVAPDTPPNILFLSVDDLRPELACYGADYIRSPHIDRLASEGRRFSRHFVQAPTCGASRYAMLTGRYHRGSNHALFQRARAHGDEAESVLPSLPGWLRQHGYRTVSVGKISHHPGGRGGPDWDDPEKPEMPGAWNRHLLDAGPWKHPRGAMHGLAHGEIRKRAGDMDVFQAAEGDDDIYPDGRVFAQGLEQLERLAADPEPFFLAVGFIRPHLPFGAPAKDLEPYADLELPPVPHPEKPEGKTTWHGSGEFMKYNRWGRNPNDDPEFALEVRRHYAACVTYIDRLVGRMLESLDDHGLADNTIVVLWGDHGFHLGEHAIWGKHALFEESLHSPLIIRAPGLPDPGEPSDAVVQAVDLFPTLTALAGLPAPQDLDGVSLVPQLRDPAAPGHPAISFGRGSATIRTATHRLIQHRDGHLELYDHRTPEGETRNLAEVDPETAKTLRETLDRLTP